MNSFEFDPTKSRSNREKHGIDFEEARLLWQDDSLLIVPSRDMNEPRFLAIARLGDKVWSAIWTQRGANIRIISVRRARDEEVAVYESR